MNSTKLLFNVNDADETLCSGVQDSSYDRQPQQT